MPQVILLAALGGALYAGYRALSRVSEVAIAELKRTQEAAARSHSDEPGDAFAARDLGKLELDPQRGVYKAPPKG